MLLRAGIFTVSGIWTPDRGAWYASGMRETIRWALLQHENRPLLDWGTKIREEVIMSQNLRVLSEGDEIRVSFTATVRRAGYRGVSLSLRDGEAWDHFLSYHQSELYEVSLNKAAVRDLPAGTMVEVPVRGVPHSPSRHQVRGPVLLFVVNQGSESPGDKVYQRVKTEPGEGTYSLSPERFWNDFPKATVVFNPEGL